MISNDVKNILTNKMTILKDEHKNDICLVGPVTLPVQLEDEVVTFQWYTWFPLKGIPSEKEKVLESLATLDLAEHQQSSVLVYGDFAKHSEKRILECTVSVILEIYLAANAVIVDFNFVNR